MHITELQNTVREILLTLTCICQILLAVGNVQIVSDLSNLSLDPSLGCFGYWVDDEVQLFEEGVISPLPCLVSIIPHPLILKLDDGEPANQRQLGIANEWKEGGIKVHFCCVRLIWHRLRLVRIRIPLKIHLEVACTLKHIKNELLAFRVNHILFKTPSGQHLHIFWKLAGLVRLHDAESDLLIFVEREAHLVKDSSLECQFLGINKRDRQYVSYDLEM